MKKSGVLLLILMISCMLVFVACSDDEVSVPSDTSAESVEDATVVYIGSVWPTTGANANLGTASEQAVQLAAADINAAGGIEALGGAKIEIVSGDAQSDASVCVSEIERIASNYEVSAFVGCQASNLTLSATEVTERLGIPLITYSMSDDLCSRGFHYTFQITPYASEYGEAPVLYAQAMMDEFGVPENKVAVVYEESDYGVSTAQGIIDAVNEVGQNLVLEYAYEMNLTDASSVALKIQNSGAQIVYMCSTANDAVLIQRAIKSASLDVTVIGCGVGHSISTFGSTLGSDADGVAVSESGSALQNNDGLAEMVARYEEKYGEGQYNNNAADAYRSVWTIKEAIEACASTDPKVIADTLYEIELTEGVATWCFGGGCKFDETGHNIMAKVGALQWQSGNLVPVWPAEMTDYEAIWPTPSWSDR